MTTTSMPHVCHFTFDGFPLITDIYEFTRHLRREGITSEIVALAFSEDEPLTDYYEGIPVHRIYVGQGGRSLAAIRQAAQALAHIIDERGYDIIHVYAFGGAGYLRLHCGRRGARWLLDIRTGSLRGGWQGWLANRRLMLASQVYDHVGVLDARVAQLVLGHHPFSELPLGVDMSRFVPGDNPALRAQLGYTDRDLVAAYTGTMDAPRDLSTLIYGFSIAARHLPELQLLMVGDGNLRPQFEQLAADLGIADRVLFSGYHPLQEMPGYTAVADIGAAYVPAIPCYECQPPLKTVEMLACGKAVLATRTQGNARFICSGENGLLVEDTPQAVAEGFCQLANPRLRQRFQRVARASVKQYDWSAIVRSNLIPIYAKLLGDN